MKNKKLIILSLSLLMLGCAQVTNGLQNVNNTLSNINSGLKGGQSIAEVKNIITSTDIEGDGRIMLLEASDNISGFLTTNACITSLNGSALNKYAVPGKTYSSRSYFSPVRLTKYHNKDTCMEIKNIFNVRVLAANAFKFGVTYVSSQSQEAIKKQHTVIKQNNGNWLFK